MGELQHLAPPVLVGILLFLFVFGSCVFSFLNVVIYRVPRHLGVIKGNSFCPFCGHVLRFDDLVPIVSRTVLKGHCRYCGERISFRYTAVEILGGIFAWLCFFRYGFSMRTVISFLFLAVCTVISCVDWDTMEIPDEFLTAVILVGVLSLPFYPEISFLQRLLGVFVISIPMFLLTLKIPGAFGGGDIKFTAAAGLLLGWQNSLLAAFLAILAGGIYGTWLLVFQKKGRKDRFAFGPFLCGGMTVALLWGDQFFQWYVKMMGL